MSADRLAASDGRPADFLYLASGQQSSPRRVSSLCFYTCATALETQPLPAVSQAHLPTTSTDCPAASNRGGRRFPGPLSGGRSAIALPRSRSSCSPLPNCFVTFRARHCPLCRSIDGVPASAGNSIGHRLAIAPPPFAPRWRFNSNHVGKRYVLGRNREISIEIRELRLSTRECNFPGINITKSH